MIIATSLLIATYNWEEALAAVLSSVRAQRDLPDEVIIADDGSRGDTAELVRREARSFPVPLRHVWHEDAGFRLGTIRNKSIAAAHGEYLIQLDGDMLLHPQFVCDHKRFARRGWYVQGSRAMLDEERTRQSLAARRVMAGPLSRGVRNRINGIHAPLLATLARGSADPLERTRGCNMAFWRDDMVRVNGYDEAIQGWGREDSELVARLMNTGVQRRNLKFAAVAWHLHHQIHSRDDISRNHEIFERSVRECTVWCERGLSQHVTSGANPRAGR